MADQSGMQLSYAALNSSRIETTWHTQIEADNLASAPTDRTGAAQLPAEVESCVGSSCRMQVEVEQGRLGAELAG